MVDIKDKESRYDLDATVTFGNKVKNLQAKLENMLDTIIEEQKNKMFGKTSKWCLFY